MNRVVHQPVKFAGNPVIKGKGANTDLAWDEDAKVYRIVYTDMWYYDKENPRLYDYAVGYAESKDGITWETPNLGLYEWRGSKENNICWRAMGTGRRGQMAYSPFLLELPKEHRRGHKFVMFYGTGDGCHLIGSEATVSSDGGSR